MALHREETKQIVNHFKRSELDTGSSEVQVALLTYRINKVTEHFKKHKQDFNGRIGLLRMVNKRRKLLDYLIDTDTDKYQKLIKELDIRK